MTRLKLANAHTTKRIPQLKAKMKFGINSFTYQW